MKKLVLICFVLFPVITLVLADKPRPADKPLPIGAHAHNDYEHGFPLWDALHNGFISIEVDVHLVDGEFLVAHDVEDVQPNRTIRTMYLDPLQELHMLNRGKVYSDGSGVILLVDVKTEEPGTWRALREVLMDYKEMLSFYRDGIVVEDSVTVVISGNRDWQAMSADHNCPAFYDGRIEDLYINPDSGLIPLISAGWGDEFAWEGQGEIPEKDRVKMLGIIEKAHTQGRKVRFWGTDVPDEALQKQIWDLLLDSGVDFINTDKLEKFRSYLGL